MHLRLHTKSPLQNRLILTANMQNSPVDVDSTDIVKLNSSQWMSMARSYKFESTVVGGAIPKEYIPAVGEGIEEAMKSGILGEFPGSRRTCECIRWFLP